MRLGRFLYVLVAVVGLYCPVGGQELRPQNTSIGLVVLGQSKENLNPGLSMHAAERRTDPDETEVWNFQEPYGGELTQVRFQSGRVISVSGTRVNSSTLVSEPEPYDFFVIQRGMTISEVFSEGLGAIDHSLEQDDGSEQTMRWDFPQCSLRLVFCEGRLLWVTLFTSPEILKGLPDARSGWVN